MYCIFKIYINIFSCIASSHYLTPINISHKMRRHLKDCLILLNYLQLKRLEYIYDGDKNKIILIGDRYKEVEAIQKN